MDAEKYLNKLVELKKTDKLFNSIAKLICNEEFGTGFFIKLNIDQKIVPYFCTAKHCILGKEFNYTIEKIEKIQLIFYQKNESNMPYKTYLSLNENNKKIHMLVNDTALIEVLDNEIPEGLNLNYLELETEYLFNPTEYNGMQAIMVGYPNKYLNYYDNTMPFISQGRIKKIKTEENEGKIFEKAVYDMETDVGSSGAPVCVITEKNELKLIGIHNSHDPSEKNFYNDGALFGFIIKQIENNYIINVNNDNNMKSVKNIIKHMHDILEELLKIENEEGCTEIFDKCFLQINDYQYVKFLKNRIDEERLLQNEERFLNYYKIFNNHLITSTNNILGDSMNKILTIFNNFKDVDSTYNIIYDFNHDIINSFNTIILSEDYRLKVKIVYFIAAYINALINKKCRYNNKDVILYQRTIMNLKDLNNMKDIAKNGENEVVFKYFFDELIPLTFLNQFYKIYYDIKMYLETEISKTLGKLKASYYDTKIYIEQEYREPYYKTNCFKIYNGPGIIITPFSYFHIKKVEINKNELTAEVYLKLIAKNENECFI